MKVNWAIIILFSILFASCEREQLADLQVEQVPKLCATSFLGTSDSILYVSILRSQPVIGYTAGESQAVPDADVSISDGVTTIPLVFNEPEQRYSTGLYELQIIPGNNYTLTVSQNGEIVSGTTKVPSPAPVNMSVSIDSVFNTNSMYYDYRVTLTAKAEGEGVNYFRFIPLVIFEDSFRLQLGTEEGDFVQRLGKGESRRLVYNMFGGEAMSKPVRLDIIALTTDYPYYEYHRTTGRPDFLMSLPFGEPSFIYSNLSNRVGVLAAYSISRVHSIPFQ